MSWQEQKNVLEKLFRFKTFKEAIVFINRVAEVAERLNHHPDIFLHDYNQIRIQTTTHDEGKITIKDHNLAVEIDALATTDTK